MRISLKACRVNVKASVRDVARAIGVSEDTVYKWEGGKCSPRLRHAQKLVDYFNSKDPSFNISINDIKFLV